MRNFHSSFSLIINMNSYFICQNGQNISWTFLCDGYNQCLDGSDERNCDCFFN